VASADIAFPPRPDSRITVSRSDIHFSVAAIDDEVNAFDVLERGLPVALVLLDHRFKLGESMLDVFIAAKRLALKGLVSDLERVEGILKVKRAPPYPRPG
jgi:hypothetical protein